MSKDFVADAKVNLLLVRVLSASKQSGLTDSWISTASSGPELADLAFYNHISKCLWRLLRAVPNEFKARLKYAITSIAELVGFAASRAFMYCTAHIMIPEESARCWLLAAGWYRAEVKLFLR